MTPDYHIIIKYFRNECESSERNIVETWIKAANENGNVQYKYGRARAATFNGVAASRGTDVDKPPNLAKRLTEE